MHINESCGCGAEITIGSGALGQPSVTSAVAESIITNWRHGHQHYDHIDNTVGAFSAVKSTTKPSDISVADVDTDLWRSIAELEGFNALVEEEIRLIYTLMIERYQLGWDHGHSSTPPTPLGAA